MTFFADDFDPTEKYATVPNHWFRDPRLSLKGKGFMSYLKGHKPGYKLTLEQMIAETKDGKDAIYGALKELRELDYLKMVRDTHKGKVVSVSYKWGPAAFEQIYERAWPPKQTAGETTSGFSRSGEVGQESAAQTTSGFSGSGKTGSGKTGSGGSATNNTSSKNPKRKNPSSPPPPAEDSSAAEDVEAGGEEGKDCSTTKNPDLDTVVAWFTNKYQALGTTYPNWRAPVIRETLTAAVAKELGDLRQCSAALRELADGKHGITTSARRLLHAEGPWWTSTAPAPIPRQQGPRCPKDGHAGPQEDCKQCLVEAKAASTAAEQGPLDPEALARSNAILAGRAGRMGGGARLREGLERAAQMADAV